MAKTVKIKRYTEELKKVYANIEREIEKFNGRIICQKGCSLCCRKAENYGYPVEAAQIVVFLNTSFPVPERLKISENIKEFDQKFNLFIRNKGTRTVKDIQSIETLIMDSSRVNLKCPFLSDVDDCLIYPVRPFICRIYVSYSRKECEGMTEPSVMQSESFHNFMNGVKKALNSLNKDFLIQLGYDPMNVLPLFISRFIEYDHSLNEFIHIGPGGKRFRLV